MSIVIGNRILNNYKTNGVNILLQQLKDCKENDKIVFLKSWNEWGEGNYMEPDIRFGKKYIEVLGSLREEEEKKI
mgnify:CR=1 FL=1